MGRVWLVITGLLALVVGGLGYSAVQVYLAGSTNAAARSDAIVVLGAAEWNGRPSPALRDRLEHALGLYRDGLAPLIITTGGIGNGSRTSEGAVGRQYLVDRGVPASAVLAEETSTSTVENLRNAIPLLEARGARSVIAVSSPYHMRRVLTIADDLGLAARGSPSNERYTGRFPWWDAYYTLRESLAYPLYLITRT